MDFEFSNMTSKDGTGIRLANVRFDKITPLVPDNSGRYRVRILISKEDEDGLERIRNAATIAAIRCCNLYHLSESDIDLPFHDGAETGREDYWETIFIDTYSDSYPVAIGLQSEIESGNISSNFYSGCYGCAALRFEATAEGIDPQLLFAIKTAEGIPILRNKEI